MRRRDFVKSAVIACGGLAGGVGLWRASGMYFAEPPIPSVVRDGLCDLARGIAFPTPSTTAVRRFDAHLSTLRDGRLISSYLDYYSNLRLIAERLNAWRWSDPPTADRLMTEYADLAKRDQAIVTYGDVVMSALDAPVKDMLLFFATGKGEVLRIDERKQAEVLKRRAEGPIAFEKHCATCHDPQAIRGQTASEIQAAKDVQPLMSQSMLDVTQEQVAAIAEYLARIDSH